MQTNLFFHFPCHLSSPQIYSNPCFCSASIFSIYRSGPPPSEAPKAVSNVLSLSDSDIFLLKPLGGFASMSFAIVLGFSAIASGNFLQTHRVPFLSFRPLIRQPQLFFYNPQILTDKSFVHVVIRRQRPCSLRLFICRLPFVLPFPLRND